MSNCHNILVMVLVGEFPKHPLLDLKWLEKE